MITIFTIAMKSYAACFVLTCVTTWFVLGLKYQSTINKDPRIKLERNNFEYNKLSRYFVFFNTVLLRFVLEKSILSKVA